MQQAAVQVKLYFVMGHGTREKGVACGQEEVRLYCPGPAYVWRRPATAVCIHCIICMHTCTIKAQSVYVQNIIKGRLHANDATEGGSSTPGARSPVRGPAVWAVDALVGSGPVSVAVAVAVAVSRGAFPGRGREKRHC